MIKTKKKGSRLELKTKAILEKEGYHVTKSGGSLGTFDLIAMRKLPCKNLKWKYKHSPDWRLIQVKSNYCSKIERLVIKHFIIPLYCQKEIWIWKDRVKEPSIEIYS